MIDHTISVLIALTKDLPIGPNLAPLQFLWMLVSRALLPNGARQPPRVGWTRLLGGTSFNLLAFLVTT